MYIYLYFFVCICIYLLCVYVNGYVRAFGILISLFSFRIEGASWMGYFNVERGECSAMYNQMLDSRNIGILPFFSSSVSHSYNGHATGLALNLE